MLFGPKRSGPSLVGLLIIIGLLYFTGAGNWLWTRVKELPSACYDMLGGTGRIGGSVCDGTARAIGALDDGASGITDQIRSWFGRTSGQSVAQMQQFSDNLLGRIGGQGSALSGLASSGERLKAMMRTSPISLPSSADAQTRLRTALDQFVIGQRLLQSSTPDRAMPWFQQSAEQPGGYGVLSQLALGDMYRTGSHGVAIDNSAAVHYYAQAQHSLETLKQDKTEQARQLLASLPVEAHTLSRQLGQILAQLKTQPK